MNTPPPPKTAPSMGASHDGRRNNRPPAKTQFKQGRSGNPAGRPKKNTSIDVDEILKGEAAKTISASEGRGRKIRLTKVEATAHQLVNAALKGDTKAIDVVLGLATKLKDLGALDELVIVRVRWSSPDEDTEDWKHQSFDSAGASNAT